ncbi:hypothetical protein P3S68_026608 [Capsicum galapagoense]
MAFRFGGRLWAAGAHRELLRAIQTDISFFREYCQQVPAHRVIFFAAGGASSFAFCHAVLGSMVRKEREQ